MLRRLAPCAALAATASALLAGCSPTAPTETTPATSASETHGVDERQLSVETREAWDAYQAVLTEFGAEPALATRERLLDVATAEVTDVLLANFQDAANRRIHTEGTRQTMNFQLADIADAPGFITAHVCVDVSGERVMGDEGIDLTPADREALQASAVEFSLAPDRERYLVDGQSSIEEEVAEACG